MGYRGSDKTVRRYLQPLRSALNSLPSAPAAPSVRQATGWLTRHPDRLSTDERTELEALLERSPALATTRDLVHDFAEIMIERRGSDLGAWMTDVDTNGDRALRSFVTGLRRDLDAVTAGLTLPYSSGPVEGHINRIILWNLRCSNARCTDAPTSICSANASSTPYSQAPQQNHEKCARSRNQCPLTSVSLLSSGLFRCEGGVADFPFPLPVRTVVMPTECAQTMSDTDWELRSAVAGACCRFHVSVSVFQISRRWRVGCPSAVSAGIPNLIRFRRSQDWLTDPLLPRRPGSSRMPGCPL
ncbi:transposase [Rhodococcus sp. ACS1]|uniref:DesA/ISL3 alpha bundle tail domain-containing protein n=1 Tax=Rhodococcus sp. ACS1 TaxID=2028570 RepID=UPI0027B93A1E|nr:transposase [Rhodococcus sp. ACS1]